MLRTCQEIRIDLSSAGRGNIDIDFYEGQEESPLEDNCFTCTSSIDSSKASRIDMASSQTGTKANWRCPANRVSPTGTSRGAPLDYTCKAICFSC